MPTPATELAAGGRARVARLASRHRCLRAANALREMRARMWCAGALHRVARARVVGLALELRVAREGRRGASARDERRGRPCAPGRYPARRIALLPWQHDAAVARRPWHRRAAIGLRRRAVQRSQMSHCLLLPNLPASRGEPTLLICVPPLLFCDLFRARACASSLPTPPPPSDVLSIDRQSADPPIHPLPNHPIRSTYTRAHTHTRAHSLPLLSLTAPHSPARVHPACDPRH